MTNRLAEHIEQDVSEERFQRLWQGIEARRPDFAAAKKRPLAIPFAAGLAVAAGVSLGWYFGAPFFGKAPKTETAAHLTSSVPLAAGGAALQTGEEALAVDLSDGSTVTLAPHSRVAMQETHSRNVALSLDEGRVACRVAKDQARVFSVLAGAVTVRVVGTHFSVERKPTRAGEQVLVDVEEGIVEVSGPDGERKRLAAGESWSIKVKQGDANTNPHTSPPLDTSATAKPEAKVAKVDRGQTEKEARDLFEEARAKRNTGDAAGAARTYQEFLRRYGSDSRSGLAALELGRLKMDELGDTAGAIAPLIQASSRGAGGLGDDALARLAEAYSRLGQTGNCQRTRTRYLKSYPQGVHAQQVRSLCP